MVKKNVKLLSLCVASVMTLISLSSFVDETESGGGGGGSIGCEAPWTNTCVVLPIVGAKKGVATIRLP